MLMYGRKQQNKKRWVEGLNGQFSKENIYGQKTFERMLNITDHQKVQIKATVMHHLTPFRMAIIKMSTNKCW